MRPTRTAKPTGVGKARPDGITGGAAGTPSRAASGATAPRSAKVPGSSAAAIGPHEGAQRAPAGRERPLAKDAPATDAAGTSPSLRRPPGGRRIGDQLPKDAQRAKAVTPEPKARADSPKPTRQRRKKQVKYDQRLELRISKAQLDELRQLHDDFEAETGRRISVSEAVRYALDNQTGALVAALGRARDMAGAGGGDSRAIVAATDELAEASRQLRFIGLNVNQLAKASNAGARVSWLDGVRDELEQIKGSLASIGVQLQQAGYGSGDVEEALMRAYRSDKAALKNAAQEAGDE